MHFKMLHFAIFFYLAFFSKSDNCDGCEINNDKCVNKPGEECSSYCKPNLLNSGDTTCYYCSDADNTNNKYYIINGETCTWTSSCDGLIVKNHDQCVSGSCGNLYKLGDYCYKSSWFGSNSIVSCDLNHDCRCIYKYHIVENEGKKSYHCYEENESCDSAHNFYYLEENLCSGTDCPNLKKKLNLSGNNVRCSNIFINNEFLITKVEGGQNRDYCEDDCNGYTYIDYPNKKCIDNCNSLAPIRLYEKSDKCVDESQCNFIDGSKCMTSCSGDNKYHKINDKNCIFSCNSDTTYKYELDYICYSECPSHFIEPNEDKCISIAEAVNCFYIETEIINHNRKCYRGGCPTDYYHNKDSKKCITSCNISGNTYKFHRQGDFVCYSSCLEIPDNSGASPVLGRYIYENNGVCSDTPCSYYASDPATGVKKCYQDENACKTAGYSFINGNECVYNCPNFKFVSTNALSLGICFESIIVCQQKNYFYYNVQDKLCWREGCGTGYYTNEIDTSTSKPKPDNSGNTCTKNCFYPYPKLSSDGKFCKTKCEDNEFFKANEPNKCILNLATCNDFLIMGDNNECVSACPLYYYEEDGKKICTSDCNTVSKFHYYDNDKKCRDDCNIFSNDNKRCLKQCSQNEKVYNNHCVSDCKNTDSPYYVETTINDLSANKCVLNCIVENETYLKIIAYINKCVRSCPEQYTEINSMCYPKCPEGKKYLNPKTLTCEEQCPSDLPVCEKFEESDICICKLHCDGTKQYIFKGECVSICPEQYNKIGKNNECKDSCLSDENGEFYIDTEQTTATYKIYKCCTSCSSEGANYFKDKECFKRCPAPLNYVIYNENECLLKCPDEYPYYNKNSPDTNVHIICSNNFNCNSDPNIYFLDGECVAETRCTSSNKNYIENKICVSYCKEGSKYKKINDNIYECKDECAPSEYILDNKECLDKCPNGKNFIGKNNICKIGCEEEDGLYYYLKEEVSGEPPYKIYKCIEQCSGYYHLSVRNNNECFNSCSDTNGYPYLSSLENMCFDNCIYSSRYKFRLDNECLLDCSGETKKYYYEEEKICSENCNTGDYAIQTINECVPNCNTLTDNVYYSYTNTGVGDIYYEVDTCVLQCPQSKPFADGTTCVDICPETSRYYIKEFKHGETDLQRKCLNDCPENYPFYTIIPGTSPTSNKYPC